MAANGAISVNIGFLPVSRRKFSLPPQNVSTPRISPRRSALSTEQAPTNLPKEVRFEKQSGTDKIEKPRDDPEIKRLSLKDYIEQSRELIRSDGGPPRWFSPLECRSRLKNSPPLLFLPGIDGTGLGLILHHQRLGKIFDIWCLHIPVMDRTPFEDLVQLVERTIRSEYFRAPNRPIYLVGESLGGCLALSVAARNPDIDLVLLLANPATSFSKLHIQPLVSLLEVVPDQFPLTFPPILDLIAGNPLEKAMAGIGKGLPPQQTIGELVQDLFAWIPYLSVLADILPRESLWWKLQMLKSASSFTNSRLHAVKSQTLILSSGKDQFLPSKEEAERLQHALQTCQVRHFEDKNHSLLMEDDIDLVTIIKGACFYRRSKYHDRVADYMPPTYSEFEQAVKSYRWLDITVNPVMFSTLEDGKIVKGLAGIPFEGPVVLVGYHMLLGWDVGPLVSRFFSERNILLRGIAHPMMFERVSEGLLPDISAFDSFRIMGAVPVSATNFYKLLSAGSHILLYPGGIREALHRKGEEYKLFWPEQSEFVRMAARFGAKIIPFGSVGEDDLCEVFFDYDDLRKIPYFKAQIEELSKSAVRLRTAVDGEVANQDLHLPGMIPKFPGRYYFLFGKPIETEGRKQELRDRQRAHELYLHAKSEVERCISYLKEKREKDPYRNLLPRLFYQATQGYSSEVPTFEL